MLKCSNWNSNWLEHGNQWERNDGKIDYRCGVCGIKRKPWDVKSEDYQWEANRKIDELKSYIKYVEYKNILVVGDLHLPFTLEGYLEFCKSVYYKYNCDHVIFMGDVIDNHFSSFHATDPDGMGAGDELDLVLEMIQEWAKVFPKADVCHGNHDLIQLRKAYKEGISKRWIKDFGEVLGVNWNFQPSFEYNNCLFRHGMNMKAAPKSGSEMMNVIQGHFHTEAYITWLVGRGNKVFGMQVPCGIDRESYAMAYAKEFPKPAIGCAVLLESGRLPIIEMMDL